MATPLSRARSTTAARRRKPVPEKTSGILAPQRCPEITRTDRGYERCHLDEHGPEVRHHVRDRSWRTDTLTPCLQLGQPCGEACGWPDHVVPYLGSAPLARDSWPRQVQPHRPPRLGRTKRAG